MHTQIRCHSKVETLLQVVSFLEKFVFKNFGQNSLFALWLVSLKDNFQIFKIKVTYKTFKFWSVRICLSPNTFVCLLQNCLQV